MYVCGCVCMRLCVCVCEFMCEFMCVLKGGAHWSRVQSGTLTDKPSHPSLFGSPTVCLPLIAHGLRISGNGWGQSLAVAGGQGRLAGCYPQGETYGNSRYNDQKESDFAYYFVNIAAIICGAF